MELINDYTIHWWNGDAGKYYKFMFLEVSQANKIFKVGLYVIGLAAIFDLIKFKDFVCTLRGSYCKFIFISKVTQLSLNIINILAAVSFIPSYYIMAKIDSSKPMPIKELICTLWDIHKCRIVDEASIVTSRKWINRLLLWTEKHPPTDRQIRITVYSMFVIMAALEIITS